MTEAVGITCIVADVPGLGCDDVDQLYHLAQDLKPCIVFLMNIDRCSQSKIKRGCQEAASLIFLLTILAGIEEYEGIVTVATASHAASLDTTMLRDDVELKRFYRKPGYERA